MSPILIGVVAGTFHPRRSRSLCQCVVYVLADAYGACGRGSTWAGRHGRAADVSRSGAAPT
ncbi:hypothetical protein OH77DRAFT_93902 [Trametes cingulata]|nr:hypothetical protein OH77DRAFT_93902 [Trametes cingulata]